MSDIFDKILAETPKDLTQFIDQSMDITLTIKDLLRKKGLTQKDLAQKLGKSEAEISKWLTTGYNLTLNSIAKIEVAHRPTPDSYDLLAWSYFNHGDIKKAYAIAQQYVYGKSHEPMLNYHLAVIYKANQNSSVIAPIVKELRGSIYELGPSFEKKLSIL